jgi:hypothetical protein
MFLFWRISALLKFLLSVYPFNPECPMDLSRFLSCGQFVFIATKKTTSAFVRTTLYVCFHFDKEPGVLLQIC